MQYLIDLVRMCCRPTVVYVRPFLGILRSEAGRSLVQEPCLCNAAADDYNRTRERGDRAGCARMQTKRIGK
jgi:hypothetical protein